MFATITGKFSIKNIVESVGNTIQEKRKKEKMTLEKAIDMLKKEYELAKKQGYIRNPLAWALYQVWRAEDRMKGENHETQKD